jgi:D-arabinose 1-dehydrogenase-like Zn-dependent alcohol dehydrogenase
MEQESFRNFEHPLYQHITEEKDADAVAWAFVNKDEMFKFPFKFSEIGEDEVRANVTYTGLCHSDVLTSRSKWGPANYPIAPGHEIIGVVSKVGANVTDFRPGDKVAFGVQRDSCDACKFCNKELENLCQDIDEKFTYGFYWGGYATQIQQPSKFFFKYPDGLDEKRAAPLLCAGITVYYPIKQYVKEGDKTAVIGIGGLGHLAVQFLAKLGYHVTAFSSSLDKKEFLHSLGANEVVNYTDPKDMKRHANQYDFVINTLPVEDGFDNFLNIAAPRCNFVQVGLPEASKKINFSCFSIVAKEVKIIGSVIGPRKAISEMLDLCVKKNIYPMVEEFDFENFPKAFDRLENGRPKFRCVVNVEEYSKKNDLFK